MYLLIAAVTIGMASCSTGRYVNNSQNVNLSQTQVVLSKANFQVVKHVSVTYIYKNTHFVQFYSSQMKESAYAALVKKAGLTGAQTIINVTMEQIQRESHNFWTLLLFPPKYEQAILVSGTVIEFLPEGVTPTNSNVIESSIVYEDVNGKKVAKSTFDNKKDIEVNNQALEEQNAELPQVTRREGVSTYSLLKERYATNFPLFWQSIDKVRNYYSLENSYKQIERIADFLLSDKETEIRSLMAEIKGETRTKDIAAIFLKYADK